MRKLAVTDTSGNSYLLIDAIDPIIGTLVDVVSADKESIAVMLEDAYIERYVSQVLAGQRSVPKPLIDHIFDTQRTIGQRNRKAHQKQLAKIVANLDEKHEEEDNQLALEESQKAAAAAEPKTSVPKRPKAAVAAVFVAPKPRKLVPLAPHKQIKLYDSDSD